MATGDAREPQEMTNKEWEKRRSRDYASATKSGYDFENEASETRKWRLALNSLTPGGSEFADDSERCVQHIKGTRQMQHRLAIMFGKRAHIAEEKLRQLQKHVLADEQKILATSKGWL